MTRQTEARAVARQARDVRMAGAAWLLPALGAMLAVTLALIAG